MNGITLTPINVYPEDYGLGKSRGGSGGTPPLLPMLKVQAQLQRDGAYLTGNWWSIIDNLLRDAVNNRPRYSLTHSLMGDLIAAHHADQIKSTDPIILDNAAWQKGRDQANRTNTYNVVPALTAETELSGGILSPVKALAHSIMGKGTPLQIRIERIGIKPTPTAVPELKAMIDNAPIGRSPLDTGKIGYFTGRDSSIAAGYLGNISLRITGEVIKGNQGHYTFHGEARAYNDLYDANRSNHRTPFGEATTTSLRHIMQNTGAQSYEIQIHGSLPIQHIE